MSRFDRLDLAWIMLLGLALATVAVSASGAAALPGNTLVLILAVIKGRIVILDYLGLRAAPALWRGLVTGWVIGLATFGWASAALRSLI